MHPIARRSLKTLAWVAGICATIVLAWFGFWMYPGLTPSQTADILVNDPKFAHRALTTAPLWGDRLLPRLREQSQDFTRLRLRNALLIAGILADRRSEASREMSRELFARDSLLPKLIGAVGLASHGLLPAAEFQPGGWLKTILADERLFAHSDSVEFSSYDEYVVILAIEAAKRARARESVPDVVRLLSSRQHRSIKDRAADALGSIGDARAKEPLRDALRDSSFVATSRAFRALVALGDTAAAVPLAIERLEPQFDRWGYLLDAVKDVTDEDFGYDREAWRRWWAARRTVGSTSRQNQHAAVLTPRAGAAPAPFG